MHKHGLTCSERPLHRINNIIPLLLVIEPITIEMVQLPHARWNPRPIMAR